MGGQISRVKNIQDVGFLAGSIALNQVVGSIAGAAAGPSILGWYKKLKKPSWTPPNLLFGPMWTVLYASMSVASWMVFKKGGWQAQKVPLSIYGVQLLFNFAWNPLFFLGRRLDIAFADVSLLLASCVATTAAFAKVDRNAGLLFVPTVVWVGYAAALNYSIMKKNPQAHKITIDGKDTRND